MFMPLFHNGKAYLLEHSEQLQKDQKATCRQSLGGVAEGQLPCHELCLSSLAAQSCPVRLAVISKFLEMW